MLQLAGGLTPFTFTPNVQLERTVDGRGRETLDLALDAAGRATPVSDGELLLVSSDNQRAIVVGAIAPTLQALMDDWSNKAPTLEAMARDLEAGERSDAFDVD